MRYLALASDYDGTLAHDGRVDAETLDAVARLKKSGRLFILVTGRELPELLQTFPEYAVCDLIVAENGALLYDPKSKQETVLADAPPPQFVSALKAAGVSPLGLGRVIVATWDQHRDAVLRTIQEQGLELQVIFNKGAVMVLPAGVNKAFGLAAALDRLKLSAHNVVGIGDAENDHAFLRQSECAVAVSNALPSLKEQADLVTAGDHGRGVAELIGMLLADDLAGVRLNRHDVLLGTRHDGQAVKLPVYGERVLVAGGSGGGKSTLTTGLLERLTDVGYQFCVVDPEGDYPEFSGAIVLGDAKRAASPDEVLAVLERPLQNVIVNLLGIALEQRPAYFEKLLPRLQELRTRTGRPHWIVLDEAMHVLPTEWQRAEVADGGGSSGLWLVTMRPQELPAALLGQIDVVLAVGQEAPEVIKGFCGCVATPCPAEAPPPERKGEVIAWFRSRGDEPGLFQVEPCRSVRARHSRKYATAELTPDRSFFFRGPANKLNLRAQNLMTFAQLLDGVDDETWLFHLQQHDYSRWFKENIKSEELAEAAAAVEQDQLTATESRQRIRAEIEARYTLPG